MKWRVIGGILSLGGAAMAIAWLFIRGDVRALGLSSYISAIHITALLLIAACTASQMICGAVKWRLVLERIAPETSRETGFPFFFFYTCLAGVLAQFVTVYLASVIVRSLATRFHYRVPVLNGALSSGFEQVLDVYVLCLFAVPTIVVLLAGWSLPIWVALAVLATAFGYAALGGVKAISRLLDAKALRMAGPLKLLVKFGSMLDNAERKGLIEVGFLRQLFLLSTVRYVALLFRTLVILQGASFLISPADAIYGHTIVQASQLASLTPGNLGIAEWSWVGVLSIRGYELQNAAEFAVTVRILAVASIVAAFALSALIFAVKQRSAARGQQARRRDQVG